MATAGSIVVDLLMRTGSFETDADRASKKVKKLGKDSSDSAAQIGAAFGKVGGTVAGGLTVATTAVFNWTRQLVNASTELGKLSQLSGTTDQVFQRMAAGASTVGVQQDKLADIFKDTQDKLGDFFSTGGGAMADFFEQIAPRVNLTADAFRNLSGPEVLQKYYKALEDAGASQADMVFYMEAIASDSAMLAPLLANNGDGFRRWGAEAERAGAILDGKTLAAMREVKEQSNQMDIAFQGLKAQIASELLPQFSELVKLLGAEETKSAFVSIAGLAAQVAGSFAEATVASAEFIGKINDMRKIDTGGELSGLGSSALRHRSAQLERDIASAVAARDRIYFESDRRNNERRLASLKKLRGDIEAELKRRSGPQVTLIDNGQPLPESALRSGTSRRPGTFIATPVDAGESEAEKAAKRLADALKAANEQLERQAALWGDASELSRVSYDIQFGGLQGIDKAAQAALLSSASLVDMLGNIDEAQAIMAEDAQKFADAFHSMFGIADDEISESGSVFGQFSASADQAARNMHDSFADFLFDPFAEGTSGMVKGFGDALKRMAAEAAATEIFQAVGRWASTYNGAGASWVNAFGSAMGGVAGGRAGGGTVAGGSLYRVGEGGRPELFEQGGKTYLVPGEGGSVRPITAGRSFDGGAGGGTTMKVEIVNNGAPARVERAERSRGANGEDLLRIFISAAADDLANGGQLAQAGKGRFDWQERV